MDVIGPTYSNYINHSSGIPIFLFGDTHLPPQIIRRSPNSIFITNHIDNLVLDSKYPVDLYIENNETSIETIFNAANTDKIPSNLIYSKKAIQDQLNNGTLNMPPLPAVGMFFITNAIDIKSKRHPIEKLRVHYFSTVSIKTESDLDLIIGTSGSLHNALKIIKRDGITHTSEPYILNRINGIYNIVSRTPEHNINRDFVRMVYYNVRNAFVDLDIYRRICKSIDSRHTVIIYAGIAHIKEIECLYKGTYGSPMTPP